MVNYMFGAAENHLAIVRPRMKAIEQNAEPGDGERERNS